MASKAKIVVTGVRSIDKRLRRLQAREANAVARKAIRAAMKPMKSAVQSEEPVGETGDLQHGVKLRAGKRSRKTLSIVVALDDKTFPEKWYATFKELGTVKMPADPAMRRAFDANEDRVRRDAMQRILAGVLAALR